MKTHAEGPVANPIGCRIPGWGFTPVLANRSTAPTCFQSAKDTNGIIINSIRMKVACCKPCQHFGRTNKTKVKALRRKYDTNEKQNHELRLHYRLFHLTLAIMSHHDREIELGTHFARLFCILNALIKLRNDHVIVVVYYAKSWFLSTN